MFSRFRSASAWALLLLLGAFEDIYGRTAYSGDAVNYLNIVRALHAGDWKLALSSYWGLGYPLLIALVTPLFAKTPGGEWLAVHLLNLLLFAATYVAFSWLVRTAVRSLGSARTEDDHRAVLTFGTLAVFLSVELNLDQVSRVGPDLLVSLLVFAATALLLKLRARPTAAHALALGATLGLGFAVKTVFLPLTLLFVLVATLAIWNRREARKCFTLMLLAAAIPIVPYTAAMSWAQGRFTVGDSGALNYAWNVNKLEPGGLWQGEPPQFGRPTHPTQQVNQNPRIYIFNGPFPVTFAPFFNPPYYYDGYHGRFNMAAQVKVIAHNVLRVLLILARQVLLFVLLLLLVAGGAKSSPGTRVGLGRLWPVFAVCAGGVGIYLFVFVEARYISSFVAMVLLALMLIWISIRPAIRQPRAHSSQPLSNPVASGLMLGACLVTLALNAHTVDRDLPGHALHAHVFSNDPQTRAAAWLLQSGVQPGDKVAVMTDLVSASRSTWAYLDQLQIVAILGGSLLAGQRYDLDAYWHGTPARQQQYLGQLRSSGARMVLTDWKPADAQVAGWQNIPATPYWIYKFD